MAKKKKKQAALVLKERFKNSVMYGNIKGVILPKILGELSEAELRAIYNNNPSRAGVLFEADLAQNLQDEQTQETGDDTNDDEQTK